MRFILMLIMLACAVNVSAQVEFRVDYNFSGRIENHDKKTSNQINVEASYKRILLSVSFGKENWYYKNTSIHVPDSVNYPKCKANKLDFFVGYQVPISKKGLDIRILYGIRTYFQNEVEKNLSFYLYGSKFSYSDEFILSGSNRESILNTYPTYEINHTYRFINQMNYAHLLKINVSYTYKNIGLNVYYMPNLIHFEYETPLEPKEYGSNHLLFHDVGVGLSYTFKVKPKKQG